MSEYRFYRESSGEWETVQPERWQWVAKYLDGSILKQFDDETGLFHQFKEIDQSKLLAFYMVNPDHAPYVLHWIPGRKLIHFYPVYKLDHGTPNERIYRIYCFGFEGGGNKVIMCIMPDDGLIITDDHEKIKVK